LQTNETMDLNKLQENVQTLKLMKENEMVF
jgi:hypothetical protein